MNSTEEGLVQPAGPCAIAIFGAAGDLTKRLLMPALYNLAGANLLPKEFAIVGVSKRPPRRKFSLTLSGGSMVTV